MTISIDPRAGSANLVRYIDKRLQTSYTGKAPQLDADIEFAGWGPSEEDPDEDELILIGIEYKSLSDCLTSMTDGRLCDTQLRRMADTYQRIYLLVEDEWRVGRDGVLESLQWDPEAKRKRYMPARGRKGEGWTAREFWGRVESIQEFFGCRVHFTPDIETSAQWIVGKYWYWQKRYSEHRSAQARDKSRAGARPVNALTSNGRPPLVQLWAEELEGIGPGKSAYVAQHFKSAPTMVLASEKDWAQVVWREKLKKKSGYRNRKFGKDVIAKIMRQIDEEI